MAPSYFDTLEAHDFIFWAETLSDGLEQINEANHHAQKR